MQGDGDANTKSLGAAAAMADAAVIILINGAYVSLLLHQQRCT